MIVGLAAWRKRGLAPFCLSVLAARAGGRVRHPRGRAWAALVVQPFPLRFRRVEGALQQAGLSGAHLQQTQGLPEAGRSTDPAAAESVAARGAERAGNECERTCESSERTAERA